MSDSKDDDAHRVECKGGEGEEGDFDFVIRTMTSREPHVVTLGRDKTVGTLAGYILDMCGNVGVHFVVPSGRVDIAERFSYTTTLGAAFGPLHTQVVSLYIRATDMRGNRLFRVGHMVNAKDSGLPWPPPNSIEPFNGGPIGAWTGWGSGPTDVPDDVDNTTSHLFGLRDGDTVTLYNVVQLQRAIVRGDVAVHTHVADMVTLHADALATGTSGDVPVVDAETGDNIGFY